MGKDDSRGGTDDNEGVSEGTKIGEDEESNEQPLGRASDEEESCEGRAGGVDLADGAVRSTNGSSSKWGAEGSSTGVGPEEEEQTPKKGWNSTNVTHAETINHRVGGW